MYVMCVYYEVNLSENMTAELFLISNFRRVLNVVCFLLRSSPASEFCMPTFRNTLFHFHRRVGMKMEQTECSETLAYKIQTPLNYPEESIQHDCRSKHGMRNLKFTKFRTLFREEFLVEVLYEHLPDYHPLRHNEHFNVRKWL